MGTQVTTFVTKTPQEKKRCYFYFFTLACIHWRIKLAFQKNQSQKQLYKNNIIG
jgi:hypothetical protein